MAVKKKGGAKVSDPKNKGSGLCDIHITNPKGETKKFRTPSREVMELRLPTSRAPRKNFCYGRDRYTMQGK